MEKIVSGPKRFRSPPYPYLSLGKAIDRASLLFQKAQHHPVGLNVLANAWGMSPQSGGLLKSVAALIQFGLVKDQGSGDARKFQLTEGARRILQDADPASEKRRTLTKAAALSPTIHKELWEKFGDPTQLSDALLKNHLLFDRTEVGEAPFSAASADEVIQTYRDAISFSGLSNDSKNQVPESDLEDFGPLISTNTGSSNEMSVVVGDLIQWESSGVLQFDRARRVRWVSEDGTWVAVEGSNTGISSKEVIIEQKTTAAPFIPPEDAPTARRNDPEYGAASSKEWMRTLLGPQTSVQIHVDGVMGPKEIGKLMKLLEVQKTILEED